MTLKNMLDNMAAEHADSVALRFKKEGRWQTLSYQGLQQQARQVAEVLGTLNVQPQQRVGLYRENSHEWPEVYFGIVGTGATAVPIDAKLQEQEVSHILRDSDTRILFASARFYPLLRQIESHLPHLESVILLEGHNVLPVSDARCTYQDYEASLGEVADKATSEERFYDKHSPADTDIASFIYTSGTTGRQKGAMLTHGNFIANVESCQKAIDIRTSDNFMLVLPLHHSFAFTTNLMLPLYCGAEISFVESLKTIGENMGEAKPTVLIAVPLLLEKMCKKFNAALRDNKVATTLMKCGLSKVVGKKVGKKLGGNLRLIVTGGAPCDPEVLRGWEKLGFRVREGYGLTETAPVLTINPVNKPKIGTVGVPLPGVVVSIMEPNEEGTGEIAAKGANIMAGYFKNKEASEAIMHGDWLLTGDMGFIDKDGYVTINGRKKALIVNREGKNIYPEEVEAQICRSPYILEALVLGYRDSGETTGERVGAIVVPDQEAIDELVSEQDKRLSEREIIDFVRTEAKRMCANISEYKRPRRIQIHFEELEKTSTAKIKRYLYAIDTTRIANGQA